MSAVRGMIYVGILGTCSGSTLQAQVDIVGTGRKNDLNQRCKKGQKTETVVKNRLENLNGWIARL
jgi:hypothetical protein